MSFDLKLQGGNLVIKNADLVSVVDTEKLIQDILKICLTPAQANPLNPWYGSYLTRSLVGNPQYTSTLVEIGKSQLTSALDNLKNLQDLQLRSFQRVSASEQLAAVKNISIIRNPLDPRLFDVYVSAISKSLKPVNTTFSVANS